MGIPYYFKYLTQNISDCVKTHIHNIPIILYIDFNSMIHEAKGIVISKLNKDCKKYYVEYLICEKTVELISNVVSSIGIHRIHTIYIAIDGIAPMAKVIQQQQRRFKTAYEAEYMRNLKKEFGVDDASYQWDGNCITPGTKFMKRLREHLENHFISYSEGVDIIIDHDGFPGEGEHKLMAHMDENREEHRNFQKVVYGLDADLIVLSILRGYEGLYLYREACYFPFKLEGDYSYYFMDVSVLRRVILEEYRYDDKERERVIKDYVMLTFLLGNDFLPNLFILKIQKGGFEMIQQLYREIVKKTAKYLVNSNNTINLEFLAQLFQGLLRVERNKLREMSQDFYRYKPRIKSDNEFGRRSEMFQYYPTFISEVDTIKLGSDGWQDRFYNYWLDCKPDQVFINKICKTYIQGLQWNLDYYFTSNYSWHWFYPYPITPCIRDLVNYSFLTIDQYRVTKRQLDQNYNLMQLSIVLPKTSHRCVPKNWRPILSHPSLAYLYPSKFPLKTMYRRFYHECLPILPKPEKCLPALLECLIKTMDDIINKTEL